MPPAVTGHTLNELLVTAAKFGLGGVLAIFLVYRLADSFDKKLDAQGLKIDQVHAQLEEQRVRDAVHVLLLKAICQNTATTPGERAVCLEAGR